MERLCVALNCCGGSRILFTNHPASAFDYKPLVSRPDAMSQINLATPKHELVWDKS